MTPSRLLPVLLIGLAVATPLRAQTPPVFADTYAAFVETLRTRCTEFENGTFDAPATAVSAAADFNGDGITDPIVQEDRFSCSSSATLFSGGTGGGYAHVFVSGPDGGYTRFEFLSYDVLIVTPQGAPGRPLLVLPVHGAQCDLVGAPCYVSYVWSEEGRFVSPSGAVTASE